MPRHPLFAAVACGVIAVALAGCGDSDDKSDAKKPALLAPESDAASSGSGPSGTPDLNTSMKFKHQPGQAAKVQSALISGGFRCTRHGDESIDLRMCSKGAMTAPTDGTDPQAAGGSVAFYSDRDGTVLLARIITTDNLISDVDDHIKAQMLESILPGEDAAVVEADGSRLTWGEWVKGESQSNVGWLVAKGYDPTNLAPVGNPLPVTKEQSLAKFKQVGLSCHFGDAAGIDTENKYLTCFDDSFASSDPDAIGVSATIRVEDADGRGITGIVVTGSHATVADDLRGVRSLAPKLSALGDSDAIKGLAGWITSNLDGKPHAGYVGPWMVRLSVSPESSMLGDSISVSAAPEEMALGLNGNGVTGN